MSAPALGQRLAAVFSQVDPCRCVADVGCDHGHLAAALIESNRAERVIAVDISAASLKKAEALLRQLGFLDRADCRHSDGLTSIKAGEATQAVIAGMGGREIIRILSAPDRVDGIQRFVVVPHTEVKFLRESAPQLGLYTAKDFFVEEDGRFYSCIVLETGAQTLTEEQLNFGVTSVLQPSAVFFSYLARREQTLRRLIAEHGRQKNLLEELHLISTAQKKLF